MTRDEWLVDRTLRAVVERITPADRYPSGWAAGGGDRLVEILLREQETLAGPVTAGLRDLDRLASALGRADFAALSEAEQDQLLQGKAPGHSPHPDSGHDLEAFVGLMSGLCAQSFYGDGSAPGWPMVGYRELPPGKTWPDGEVQAGPTIVMSQLRHRYDVVVVGAGAGGGVAAMVLAEAGFDVLVVERGQWLDADDLPRDHLRSERSITGYATPTGAGPGHPRVLDAPTGPVVVPSTDPRWSANATTVGGGSRVYGAQAWRFAPHDFRMATRYGIPADSSLADWPIGYNDLEPWYDRAEWQLGVSGVDGGNRFAGHRTRGYPMPPLPPNSSEQVLRRGATQLGLLVGTVPLLINSIARDGRPACLQCGACVGFACAAGAKNGTHNTALPRAIATGRCHLLTTAQATRLTSYSGRVTGVAIVGPTSGGGRSAAATSGAETANGRTWQREVLADRVVLGAGAIETARLLLNSTSDVDPTGVGNKYDQVGRHLQAHVYAGAVGLFDDVVQDSLGPGPCIATHDYRHDNPGIVGGGMLANDFVPTPLNAWGVLGDLGMIPRWGVGSKDGMRQLYRHMQMVLGPIQEVTNPVSRVRLRPEATDRYGVPVAMLSGDIHQEDHRTAAFLADRAVEWLAASGAHTIQRLDAARRPPGPSGGQHQAGTARMGQDPLTSVTDPWGRVWGHENVLIADGSVHVTNGGVNPVLTIMALAFRNSTAFST